MLAEKDYNTSETENFGFEESSDSSPDTPNNLGLTDAENSPSIGSDTTAENLTPDALDTTETQNMPLETTNDESQLADEQARAEAIKDAVAIYEERLPSMNSQELTNLIENMSMFAPDVFLTQLDPITNRILQLQDQMFKAIQNGTETPDEYSDTHNLSGHFSHSVGSALQMVGMQIDTTLVNGAYLEKMYALQESENPMTRDFSRKFAHTAIILDRAQTINGEESLNLHAKYIDSIKQKLASSSNKEERHHSERLLDEFMADRLIYGSQFFIDLLELTPDRQPNDEQGTQASDADTKETFRQNFALMANYMGLEHALLDIQGRLRRGEIEVSLYERIVENLGYKNITHDLPELWSRLKDEFKKYKPNEQLHEYETTLISTLDGNILDLGFGYGRHMNELKALNKSVYGVDSAEALATDYKKSEKSANIAVANWQKLPLADNSMDNAYCLGRSVLNNETPEQLKGFLDEANRVLKEGGSLLIDTPTFDSEYYVSERKVLEENMQKAGITNYEQGALIDTPNGESYTLRAFFEDAQFIANARLAGFRVERINEVEYTTHDNSTNTNVYWRLVKDSSVYSSDSVEQGLQRIQDIRDSRRAQQPINLVNALS